MTSYFTLAREWGNEEKKSKRSAKEFYQIENQNKRRRRYWNHSKWTRIYVNNAKKKSNMYISTMI